MIEKLKHLSTYLKDAHIPIGLLVFVTTTVYHFKTHIDLGPQYCNSIYALYGFLAGHAFVNRNNGQPASTENGQ